MGGGCLFTLGGPKTELSLSHASFELMSAFLLVRLDLERIQIALVGRPDRIVIVSEGKVSLTQIDRLLAGQVRFRSCHVCTLLSQEIVLSLGSQAFGLRLHLV